MEKTSLDLSKQEHTSPLCVLCVCLLHLFFLCYICVSADVKGSEFLSAVRSVCLKSGQEDVLNINHLPFCPGTRFCSVLLVCPQVSVCVCVCAHILN